MKTIYIIITVFIVLYVFLLYIIYSHYKRVSENYDHLSDNNIKLWFITYGGPNTNYHDAVRRLTTEVEDTHIFDHIIGYSDSDLKKDNDFWSRHSEFCENNRGYGCWIWKPYLIMKTLELMEYDDILFYSDAGCTINNDNDKRDNMLKLINKCKEKELLFSSTYTSEKQYCKHDILKHLKMDTEEIMNSTQFQASFMFIKKTDRIVQFVNDWYNTMCIYHLVDDTPSKYHEELPEFIDSRHDQTVFSLFAKRYGFTEDNMLHEYSPVVISRRRSG